MQIWNVGYLKNKKKYLHILWPYLDKSLYVNTVIAFAVNEKQCEKMHFVIDHLLASMIRYKSKNLGNIFSIERN